MRLGGCVPGVSRVCRSDVSRACVGRVAGVSRVCRGRVGQGVSAVCAASGCVSAAGGNKCAPGPASPPPLPSAGRFFCVCPRRGLCRTSRPLFPPRSPGTSGAARGRPPGDFLFSASCLWPSSLTPGRCFSCVPRDPRCRPLGTSSFPRGITQTQTRVFFATCAAHVAFIRRRRPGWVCCARVSAGCVKGVSAARAGCVAGVCRVCCGCVRGVSAGCVAGVGRVCRSVPRGPRPPPPSPSPRAGVSACVLDAGCAPRLPLFRLRPSVPGDFLFSASGRRPSPLAAGSSFPPETGCGFLFSACGRPRGLPLFRVFSPSGRRPSPPGVELRVPRDARRRPLGTSSSLFPGDSNTRKTDARLVFDVRRARRFYSPSPSSKFHRPHRVLRDRRPHRTAQLQISPPRKKHPPAPRGPNTRPGMVSGRPPRCARAREASAELCAGVLLACRASPFGFSTGF